MGDWVLVQALKITCYEFGDSGFDSAFPLLETSRQSSLRSAENPPCVASSTGGVCSQLWYRLVGMHCPEGSGTEWHLLLQDESLHLLPGQGTDGEERRPYGGLSYVLQTLKSDLNQEKAPVP